MGRVLCQCGAWGEGAVLVGGENAVPVWSVEAVYIYVEEGGVVC